jgi:adenine-specific DNA-methyltransferase
VSPALLAALLNSDIADQAFRCISGSVAVSAYEMEALPLPPPEALADLHRLIARKSDRAEFERRLRHLFFLPN